MVTKVHSLYHRSEKIVTFQNTALLYWDHGKLCQVFPLHTSLKLSSTPTHKYFPYITPPSRHLVIPFTRIWVVKNTAWLWGWGGWANDPKYFFYLKIHFIHNTTARAAWKFGRKAWVLKKRDEQRLEAAQMKFLRDLYGITKLDKEKNQCVRGKTGV